MSLLHRKLLLADQVARDLAEKGESLEIGEPGSLAPATW